MTTQNSVIDRLIAHVTENCKEIDVESAYDSMLDEAYPFPDNSPFSHLYPSRVMYEMCPTDYRRGLADYTGTNDDWFEIGNNYYDCVEVEKARDSFIDSLDSELSDAQDAREELVAHNEDTTEIDAQIAQLESDIKTATWHTF